MNKRPFDTPILHDKSQLDQQMHVPTSKVMESVRRRLLLVYFESRGLRTYDPSWDANGCDFAVDINGRTILVQQKARPTVDQKYLNQNLYMLFPCNINEKPYNGENYYVLIDHDWLFNQIFHVWKFYQNRIDTSYSTTGLAKDKQKILMQHSLITPFRLKDVVSEIDYL